MSQPPTTFIDVECHVLPILRLAHFAAHAGDLLHEVNGLTTVLPEFRATVDAHLAVVPLHLMNFHNITPELIRAALAYIPAAVPRDEWARVAMAIKSEYPDATGLDLFDAWSQTAGDQYDAKATRDTWRSVKAGGGVGILAGYGFLNTKEPGRFTVKQRLPGLGPSWCYHITPQVFEVDC